MVHLAATSPSPCASGEGADSKRKRAELLCDTCVSVVGHLANLDAVVAQKEKSSPRGPDEREMSCSGPEIFNKNSYARLAWLFATNCFQAEAFAHDTTLSSRFLYRILHVLQTARTHGRGKSSSIIEQEMLCYRGFAAHILGLEQPEGDSAVGYVVRSRPTPKTILASRFLFLLMLTKDNLELQKTCFVRGEFWRKLEFPSPLPSAEFNTHREESTSRHLENKQKDLHILFALAFSYHMDKVAPRCLPSYPVYESVFCRAASVGASSGPGDLGTSMRTSLERVMRASGLLSDAADTDSEHDHGAKSRAIPPPALELVKVLSRALVRIPPRAFDKLVSTAPSLSFAERATLAYVWTFQTLADFKDDALELVAPGRNTGEVQSRCRARNRYYEESIRQLFFLDLHGAGVGTKRSVFLDMAQKLAGVAGSAADGNCGLQKQNDAKAVVRRAAADWALLCWAYSAVAMVAEDVRAPLSSTEMLSAENIDAMLQVASALTSDREVKAVDRRMAYFAQLPWRARRDLNATTTSRNGADAAEIVARARPPPAPMTEAEDTVAETDVDVAGGGGFSGAPSGFDRLFTATRDGELPPSSESSRQLRRDSMKLPAVDHNNVKSDFGGPRASALQKSVFEGLCGKVLKHVRILQEYQTDFVFTTDLFCPELNLAVEIDGPHHFVFAANGNEPAAHKLNGRTVFKHHALRRRGMKLVSWAFDDKDLRVLEKTIKAAL
eukprot:g11505.t1